MFEAPDIKDPSDLQADKIHRLECRVAAQQRIIDNLRRGQQRLRNLLGKPSTHKTADERLAEALRELRDS